MLHGSGLAAGLVFAIGLVLWGLTSARLTRWNVTAPVAFVALGLVSANVLGIVHVEVSSTTVREIAEFALALVLFSDAARVNVHDLRHDAMIPGRLLAIGLPLTIGLGIAAALVCFGRLDAWLAAVIGAALAPTDAALGAIVVDDERVPSRIRRALNVESGLNDGLVTPVVTFTTVGAVEAIDAIVRDHVGHAVVELAFGAAFGAAVGFVGGWMLRREERVGWASESFVPIAIVGFTFVAFLGARELAVNGFVAAFVAGLAFGAVGRGTPERTQQSMRFVALGGELLSLLLWFLFGAFLVKVLDSAPSGVVVYALLSITLVRMVPVALSLIGSHLHVSTVLFVGWFGPRGLASVVFGLLAFDALPRGDGSTVLGAVTATVLASVVLHGLTAGPLTAWFSRRAAALADDRPERLAVPTIPTRRLG